ncbi:hypothetical protein F7725_016969 [Dissostichus mawsoni]|uniref:Uncharacterized protein n=1 Tax=Dissostichus mawsoni TaxID=36200 RepID=A0A7J5Z3S9_DISMA|nr:hypothetical protein F7725_016969 [Dissostichus mawsoni]
MEMPCMPPSLTEAVASSSVSLLRTVSYILLFRVESRTPAGGSPVELSVQCMQTSQVGNHRSNRPRVFDMSASEFDIILTLAHPAVHPSPSIFSSQRNVWVLHCGLRPRVLSAIYSEG